MADNKEKAESEFNKFAARARWQSILPLLHIFKLVIIIFVAFSLSALVGWGLYYVTLTINYPIFGHRYAMWASHLGSAFFGWFFADYFLKVFARKKEVDFK